MAGSLKDMIYTTDSGAVQAVRVDESNGELLSFEDYNGLSNTSKAPKVKEMRKVRVIDPASGVTRTIPVGKLTDDVWTGVAATVLLPLLGPLGTIAALTAFFVIELIPEKPFPLGNPADTGLQDGDAS